MFIPQSISKGELQLTHSLNTSTIQAWSTVKSQISRVKKCRDSPSDGVLIKGFVLKNFRNVMCTAQRGAWITDHALCNGTQMGPCLSYTFCFMHSLTEDISLQWMEHMLWKKISVTKNNVALKWKTGVLTSKSRVLLNVSSFILEYFIWKNNKSPQEWTQENRISAFFYKFLKFKCTYLIKHAVVIYAVENIKMLAVGLW